MALGIFANLKACKYAEYELCYGCFSLIFRTAFSKNTFWWITLYLTVVIATHLLSVNEVLCVQKY